MARTSEDAVVPHEETAIQAFANSNLTPEQSRRQAAPFLNSKELLRDFLRLSPEDQAKFVERIDQAYPTVNPQNAKFVTALGNVCSATEQLPTSAVLSAGLKKRGNIAVASGGLNDIWRGEWGGTRVAIRVFRISPGQDLKEAKAILWKRAVTWKKLSHPNIISFRGVNTTLFRLALIHDWGQNGNINQYIASHPGASRPSLLCDVAKGLQYLHSLDIPHGGLKGANVVIDQGGRALLTEYGLAPTNFGPIFTEAATPAVLGTSRWLAPEIMSASREDSSPSVMESKPADVFSFAMLTVEVFSGNVPFEGRRNEAVMPLVLQGGRPEMPGNARTVGLTGEMWKLVESCWQRNPGKRPVMEEVVREWQKFVERKNDDIITVTEEPQPMAEPAPNTSILLRRAEAVGRQIISRLRTESGPVRLRTEPTPPRPRAVSGPVHPRAASCPVRLRADSGSVRLRTDSGPVQLRLSVDTVRIRTISVAVPPGTKPDIVQPPPPPPAPRPKTPKRWKKWFCGLF